MCPTICTPPVTSRTIYPLANVAQPTSAHLDPLNLRGAAARSSKFPRAAEIHLLSPIQTNF